MATGSEWALQQAIYSALTGASAVTALVSTRIYDHIPQDSVLPYLVIGDATTLPADTKTTDGAEHTVTIHAWDDVHRGSKTIKQIMDAVVGALDHVTLTVTGFTFVQSNLEFSNTFTDADGLTRHGVQRFRVLLCE